MGDPWCILLASRLSPQRQEAAVTISGSPGRSAEGLPPRDPLAAALRRATSVASREHIAAAIAAHPERWQERQLQGLDARNLFIQPRDQGTAYEVLLCLLQLENRVSPSTPVLFLPVDCVVAGEQAMKRTLVNLVEWVTSEPRPVYLLGTVPQGPHDQLGYIVPWHDAMDMPTSVYEFIERPDAREARKLINAGGLWNTFIFGGTYGSLIKLFRPRFDGAITALRSALRTAPDSMATLGRIYDRLRPVDFSQHLLAKQTDRLHVLRLPRCGWWPLKSPDLDRQLRATSAPPHSHEPSAYPMSSFDEQSEQRG